ncbi:cation antiporter [Alkaliphilus metalliredigens QYMF]|uniref:Cation antiporter n=1 Tax=Alkaliphilus metalliredigens (strain QYMF) TaxID=293826 RepID=A6TVM2_ALKMQ|nr:Na+/H+ antiporter subunit E [Alkaliphilus metalliredigens]ABR50240.1 cation antiporter [Alkaliphilus metalliredigens QYMF]
MKEKISLLQKKHIVLGVLLFTFWNILSPRITVESILVGLVVSFGVVLYSRDIVFDEEEVTLYKLSNIGKFFSFIWCLLVEIVKANIQVAKIVLSPSMPISPKLVRIPVKFKNDFNKVLYGNAVTLTPGTLTVDITENEYLVHALTEEAAEDLIDSVMEQHVLRLEVDDK